MRHQALAVAPPAPVPAIPPSLSFREMAALLLRAAEQEAFALDALHLFTLHDATGIGASTITDVQHRCAAFYDMSLLLAALAPHEAAVRGIAAGEGRVIK